MLGKSKSLNKFKIIVDKEEIYREFYQHKLNLNKIQSNQKTKKERSISNNSSSKRNFSSGTNLTKIKTVKSLAKIRDSAKKAMNNSQSEFNKSKERISVKSSKSNNKYNFYL
jgi:hypothetical protein